MNVDLFGAVLGPPFTTRILEIAHQFLLFGVHRNNRLAVFQEERGALVDVLKLRVSIHMLVAFAGFAVRLQAIARPLQKLAHHGVADLMSFVRQIFAQPAQTARSPQQGLHRIAARCRFNESSEIRQKCGVVNDLWLAASAALADAPQTGFVAAANIIQSAVNSPSRKAGYPHHTTNLEHDLIRKVCNFSGSML
jgi:hypothetical protein